MSEPDSKQPRKPTLDQLLTSAEEAIQRLEKEEGTTPSDSHGSVAVGWIVCALAASGLVVHTFLEEDAPKVDETSVLLLAVCLFAPFVRHLRSIELGGAKAEWREDASEGLKDLLTVVKGQHSAIRSLYEEISAPAHEDEPASHQSLATSTPSGAWATPLRRILWVDDEPAGNAYELELLQKLFLVDVATSTAEALHTIAAHNHDAVISDIVRVEDGRPTPTAGLRLAEEVVAMDPPLPIFFFASAEAVELQAPLLRDRGAKAVTASYSELVQAIRDEARARFDASVHRAIGAASSVRAFSEQHDGIDYELELRNGETILMETPHWLRNPTVTALEKRYRRLSQALENGRGNRALLVTQKPLHGSAAHQPPPDGITCLTLAELPARLANP